MDNVVRELPHETFVLTLDKTPDELPDIPGYPLRRRSDTEIEVEIGSGVGLNDLFAALSQHAIKVESMRTKSNRLEELFIRLVGDGAEGRSS
jgi:ABC-2 type transport system ATP-binding protein